MLKTAHQVSRSKAALPQVYFRTMVALLVFAILLIGSWVSFLLVTQSQDLRRAASSYDYTPTPTPAQNGGTCNPLPECFWSKPACQLPPGGDFCARTDFDRDRDVDIEDFNFMKSRFYGISVDNLKADVNRDGKVDLNDYSILVIEWSGAPAN